MRNIRIVLQYNGTRYQGWQRQSTNENTIQGKIERLLSKMCHEEIEIIGSGRTDAGVHAKGQVANFHTNSSMSEEEMLHYINKYLPEDIGVIDVKEVSPRFHSRLNAKSKTYCYQVINSKIPNVFWKPFTLVVEEDLDMDAMRRAAELITGEHDFQSFTSAKSKKKSTIRRIDKIDIKKKEHIISFTFTGNGFLYHMVRIIMGTLLEVGSGIRPAETMPEVFAACNRENAGYLVPAKGLTLIKVEY